MWPGTLKAMSPADFVTLALQLSLMLAFGLGCGHLMQRVRQPVLLGEMLGGIVLGPTVCGLLFPESYAAIFPADGSVATVRGAVIKLGMLFFLFTVGLEIDLASLKRNGWTAFLVGTIGTAVPLAAGAGLVYAVPGIWGIADESQRLAFALFIGSCLANSANPVLARILLDLGLIRQRVGAIVMAATLVDDLVGWSLLAMVISKFNPASQPAETSLLGNAILVTVFFAALVLAAHWLGMPFLRAVRRRLAWPSAFVGVVIILTLLAAAAAEHLGIHAFLGPFLLGIGLTPSPEERHEAYAVINHFVLSFFVPIYFVSMGLTADFAANFNLLLVTVIFVTACVSKIAASFLGARLSGLDSRTSLAIGCGMNARGAVGLILAGIGLENHVINPPTYVALIVMALGTSILAGPLMQYFLRGAARAEPELTDACEVTDDEPAASHRHV